MKVSKSYKGSKGLVELKCTNCGCRLYADRGVAKVLCGDCVVAENLSLYPSWVKQKVKREDGPKKPRGWHWLKLYVDPNGNVFRKGQECPDEKGKFEPTIVEFEDPIERKQKKRLKKEEQRQLLNQLLTQAQSIKRKIIKAGVTREKATDKRDKSRQSRIIKLLEKEHKKVKKQLKKYL